MTASPPDFQHMCAIVVDDEPTNLKVLELILRQLHFGPTYSARSAQDLFDLVEALDRVDLILQDLFLPGEDGYAILEHIRAHPKLTATKVIAITSSTNPEEMRRARAAGFDSFIYKPLSIKLLPDQIRDVMSGGELWQGRRSGP
jgi:two-component system cell cycle response regulator DivK